LITNFLRNSLKKAPIINNKFNEIRKKQNTIYRGHCLGNHLYRLVTVFFVLGGPDEEQTELTQTEVPELKEEQKEYFFEIRCC